MLVSLMLTIVFISIALTEVSSSKESYASMVDPMVPYLPETPFNYDIIFPQHAQEGNLDTNYVNSFIAPNTATLGRVIFYDKLLSANNELSCASCHKQEFSFADNTRFSAGIGNVFTKRNVPNINDMGYFIEWFTGDLNPTLFWDAREHRLEDMVLQPILHQEELGKQMPVLIEKMNNTSYYPNLFENAFGTPTVTPERIAVALSCFLRSLAVFDSKYDKVQMGLATYTPEEQAGQDFFNGFCGHYCHHSPAFQMVFPENNALDLVCEDIGHFVVTGQDGDKCKFRSPSLRNLSLTAPYMHDGRYSTIDQVINFYSDSLQSPYNSSMAALVPGTGLHLSIVQKAQLKAFLLTLTSPTITSNEKWSDPFTDVDGIMNVVTRNQIEVYPNPSSNSFTIQFANPIDTPYEVNIFGLTGRKCKSFEGATRELIIRKGDLSPGIYLLEIKSNSVSALQTIVIQN